MRARAAGLAAALGIALAGGASTAPAAPPVPPPARITIAFTGDVGGYLEPCG